MDRLYRVLRAVFRFFVSALTVWAFSYCAEIGNTVFFSETGGQTALIDASYLHIVVFVLSLAFFYSESELFAVTDGGEKERFLADGRAAWEMKRRCRRLLGSFGFWCDAAVFQLLFFLFPVSFCFPGAVPLSSAVGIGDAFVTKLILAPLIFLCMIPGYFSAYRAWITEELQKDYRRASAGMGWTKKAKKNGRALMKIPLYSLLFSLTGMLLPAVVLGVYQVIRIMVRIWQIPAALAAAAAFLRWFRRVKEIAARRRQLGEWRRSGEEYGFEILRTGRIYSSVFTNSFGTLSVRKGGKEYAVKILYCASKYTQTILEPNGVVTVVRSVVLFKRPVFHLTTEMRPQIEPDCVNVLLITPSDRQLFIKDGKIAEAEPGTVFGGFTLHTVSSFSHMVLHGKENRYIG